MLKHHLSWCQKPLACARSYLWGSRLLFRNYVLCVSESLLQFTTFVSALSMQLAGSNVSLRHNCETFHLTNVELPMVIDEFKVVLQHPFYRYERAKSLRIRHLFQLSLKVSVFWADLRRNHLGTDVSILGLVRCLFSSLLHFVKYLLFWQNLFKILHVLSWPGRTKDNFCDFLPDLLKHPWRKRRTISEF